jgi:hypothetical protein
MPFEQQFTPLRDSFCSEWQCTVPLAGKAMSKPECRWLRRPGVDPIRSDDPTNHSFKPLIDRELPRPESFTTIAKSQSPAG